jgi:hypothetical protein
LKKKKDLKKKKEDMKRENYIKMNKETNKERVRRENLEMGVFIVMSENKSFDLNQNKEVLK